MKQQKTIKEFLRHQKQNKTAEEKRHIPETSETLDETTEDNTDISKTCQRQGSTMEDSRNISHKEDQKERIQGLYKFWNDCGKGFKTQTSLQKHRYLHRQLKLVSDMCGQGFTFISTLKQCKITNRTIATLPSMHKGCDRIFNNLGDLIHM